MPKRFTATEIWDEDWFIDLPKEYKLFWFYIKDKCDQAGFFKVNVISFCRATGTTIEAETAIDLFNKGKKRLRKVNNELWLIEDFFQFQYGKKFNLNNKMHVGIGKIYEKFGVEINSIRGVKVSKEGVERVLIAS